MNANLKTIHPSVSSVIASGHDAVTVTVEATADDGIYPAGMLVSMDEGGLAFPYDPAGSGLAIEVKGVLAEEIDTGKDTAALLVRHGTVKAESLVVGTSGTPVTRAETEALVQIGIYAV